jgi:hypothetical protein
MKKIGIIVFITAIVVGVVFANLFSFGRWSSRLFNVSVNFGSVHGSGNLANEKRAVSDFDSIDVSSVFQVELVVGKEHSIEVEADDNLIQHIETKVHNGTLRIQLDRKVSTKNHMRVIVTAPNIKHIEASGAAKISASGISGESLTIDSSGASRISLSGESATLSVDVSGASNVDAANLKAVDVNIDASGASRVDINVSGDLRADASGASRITYSGGPTSVEKHQSGAGNISPR